METINNRYLCWVVGRRKETEEELEAYNSFQARQLTAKKYGVPTIDVIGRRIWEPEERS